jgi:hypothetical protein
MIARCERAAPKRRISQFAEHRLLLSDSRECFFVLIVFSHCLVQSCARAKTIKTTKAGPENSFAGEVGSTRRIPRKGWERGLQAGQAVKAFRQFIEVLSESRAITADPCHHS